MSAEAVRIVMEKSPLRGARFTVAVALAYASPTRRGYPQVAIGNARLAKLSRKSPNQCRQLVLAMVAAGTLLVVEKGGGNAPNTYEIPLLISRELPLLKTVGVVREEPLGRTPRDDLHDNDTAPARAETPSNIIRYPKSKRVRKKAKA